MWERVTPFFIRCGVRMVPICSSGYQTNSSALNAVLKLYGHQGMSIADVTYGRGVFWKEIPPEMYCVTPSDIQTGTDFTRLPYESESFDCVVFDPPYMHGGRTVKSSINDCYKNEAKDHAGVVRLYARGLLEAERIMKRKGVIICKCQDETESGKQQWSHCEVMGLMKMFGLHICDLFVVTPGHTPAMRESYQKSARKNHSYFLIGRKK